MHAEQLLALPTWRAFDVDDAARVLAGGDASGSVQLVELAPDGTATPLTTFDSSCRGRYLPGERRVVVEHDRNGNERAQLSLLDLASGELVPLVDDPEHVNLLLTVLPGRVVYMTNRDDGVGFDLVIHGVDAGVEETVLTGLGPIGEVAADADGRRLLVTVPGEAAMTDRLLAVDLMPETEGGRVQVLAEGARFVRPQFAGDEVVVSTDARRDRIGVALLGSSWLAADDDADLLGLLAPDGATLLVVRSAEGVDTLRLHDAATGEPRTTVALPVDGVVTRNPPVFSPSGRYAALSFTAPDTPGDVVLLDLGSGEASPVTHTVASWEGPPLVHPVDVRVPAADGEQVPCAVYRPASPDGSAVVVLHGGPESQAVRSFDPVVQLLVAAGHTVLVPNVRGSTGFGKRWYSADDRERRLDVLLDLAALHDALPGLGCDPARAALWGRSYGGYLVLLGLAFQPERWAAGVDIAGISSLVTFLQNTAPHRRAFRAREYGDDPAFLASASPLTRADEIRAPLLVVHGEHDPRVPVSEARQIAEATGAELLVFPDEGHGPDKRENKITAFTRGLDLLAHL
ncbi:prolyl oligopeptidase family serine peptidase [Pseudonocardia kujensis]|uniref:S9 family peptidase n=1 Tax=Pseudonocardia kujensis TaxID=1128675 RepID=UPI001E4C81BA|nr:prolyl oligopeptidase family serine peptidase [Pseudonocardia kujensis]MCE0761648.1 prolyl oligopeptidase family serine peptidase [Pseudonocardia kujensis]